MLCGRDLSNLSYSLILGRTPDCVARHALETAETAGEGQIGGGHEGWQLKPSSAHPSQTLLVCEAIFEKGSLVVCGPEEGQHLPDDEGCSICLSPLVCQLRSQSVWICSVTCAKGHAGDQVENLRWPLRR